MAWDQQASCNVSFVVALAARWALTRHTDVSQEALQPGDALAVSGCKGGHVQA